ncbi:MAG: galactarate dehydratase, partial [Clostridia bacterium]|nr:galactarate dehydratase [Clostridia bacterium]
MRTYIQLNPRDNVAIAAQDIPKGTELSPGIVTLSDIPQGHKIALQAIPANDVIRRYGVVLGYAIEPIQKGQWINEHMLRLPMPPELDDMLWGVNLPADLPHAPVRTWLGYRNPEGGYAGTRNLLGIQTTVQCVQGVLDVAVERIRKELLPLYPHVDDVVALNHAYSCGVAIHAPEAKVPIRALRNLC